MVELTSGEGRGGGVSGHLVTLIEVSLQLVECYSRDIVLSVPAASGIIQNHFVHTCYWPLQSTFVCICFAFAVFPILTCFS